FCPSRRRHTRSTRDWSSDVCSSDLGPDAVPLSSVPDPGPAVDFRATRDCPVCRAATTAVLSKVEGVEEGIRLGPLPQILEMFEEIGRASCRERVNGRDVS